MCCFDATSGVWFYLPPFEKPFSFIHEVINPSNRDSSSFAVLLPTARLQDSVPIVNHHTHISMKYLCLVLFAAGCATAQELAEDYAMDTADPRIFFVNFTSSLVQVNATILAYALLALGIAAAAALALYYLYIESQNDSSGYGYSNYGYESNSGYNYQYAR